MHKFFTILYQLTDLRIFKEIFLYVLERICVLLSFKVFIRSRFWIEITLLALLRAGLEFISNSSNCTYIILLIEILTSMTKKEKEPIL